MYHVQPRLSEIGGTAIDTIDHLDNQKSKWESINLESPTFLFIAFQIQDKNIKTKANVDYEYYYVRNSFLLSVLKINIYVNI